MERFSDHNDLATALAEVRPAPRDAFAQELDKRVAAGFPRRSRFDNSPLAGFAAWVRTLSPQRLLFSGSTAALAAIAIATVVVATNDSGVSEDPGASGSQPTAGLLSQFTPFSADDSSRSKLIPKAAAPKSSGLGRASNSAAAASDAESGAEVDSNASYANSRPLKRGGFLIHHREIERSAEIGLLADPTDVADDSAKVFTAVHDANGIVLHSTTSSGKGAGARFELLIPSVRLGDALAAFSSIDEVRSRHEATDDITKPTVTVDEELQDSQARVDSLLAQLSGAELESEREAIAAELHAERGHAARLRSQLARLHQRTSYSRVLVRIQSGTSTDSGGAWGIGDAFHDAGHVLGIAAGVTLVSLAVIAPLVLLCLLAWLAQRLWLRTRRERALDA
jgi:hypothetical protein